MRGQQEFWCIAWSCEFFLVGSTEGCSGDEANIRGGMLQQSVAFRMAAAKNFFLMCPASSLARGRIGGCDGNHMQA